MLIENVAYKNVYQKKLENKIENKIEIRSKISPVRWTRSWCLGAQDDSSFGEEWRWPGNAKVDLLVKIDLINVLIKAGHDDLEMTKKLTCWFDKIIFKVWYVNGVSHLKN